VTPKERFLRVVGMQAPDRVPFMDFGYWPETIEAWRKQGLPEGISDDEQVETHLGLDRGFEQNEINGFDRFGERGIRYRIWPPFQTEVLAEDEDTITARGGNGVVARSGKRGASIPQFLSFPVESGKDFKALLSRLNADDVSRAREDYGDRTQFLMGSGEAIGLWIDGFYAWPRELMGMENLSVAFYEDPELVKAINRQHLEFTVRYVDRILQTCRIDYACFFEDMAYKTGPLASPAIVEEFMMPYYRELTTMLRSRGVQRILIDSDGCTLKLAPLFAEVADAHYPLEVNAGSTFEALRALCPDLALIGGVDKMALIAGRDAIDAEIAKMPARIESGGYIPAVDHRVPPDVTYDNYRYYLEKKWNIIAKMGG